MLIGKAQDIRSSEITPKEKFLNRRQLMAGAATLGAGSIAAGMLPRAAFAKGAPAPPLTKLTTVANAKFNVPDPVTPEAKAQSYNNFYEYGTNKSDPAQNAHVLKTRPWTVKVSGLVKKPQTIDIDTILRYRPLEDRIYRMRCVEAWSMCIPWVGYSLSEFINAMNPLPSAKYVQFISYYNRIVQSDAPTDYDWPYSEGLRMDEAMHPLTLLTFGSYGETLANQQGAPIKVEVPWKYGYKSPKSIVEIVFTDHQPRTLWNELMPGAYGFYSNVNPSVDRTPWAQDRERRIDSSAFPKTVQTQMFNGYGDLVGGMYSAMDLKKNY